MDRLEKYQLHEDYITANGLDRLIDFQKNIHYEQGVYDSVRGGREGGIYLMLMIWSDYTSWCGRENLLLCLSSGLDIQPLFWRTHSRKIIESGKN